MGASKRMFMDYEEIRYAHLSSEVIAQRKREEEESWEAYLKEQKEFELSISPERNRFVLENGEVVEDSTEEQEGRPEPSDFQNEIFTRENNPF